MRRLTFLSVFLSTLAIALAVTIAMRIHSYQSRELPLSGAPLPPAAQSAAINPQITVATDVVAPPQTTARERAIERARRREAILREIETSTAAMPPASRAPSEAHPVANARTVAPSPVPTTKQPAPARSAPPAAVVTLPHPAAQPQPAKSAPQDPNSDATPPQLLRIEFDPAQVHDGDDAHIVITAMDDLSGIRGISGTITSPTGKALQGFSGLREGDTNRYNGRFTVPKNAEEGLWRVNVITLSDNASNSVTLTSAHGTIPGNPTLRVVSSEADSTPPTLKSARVDKASMQSGEQNAIFVEAVDDKSGVSLVSAVLQSPNKRARIGAACRPTDGDLWQCEISLSACIDCGNWQLEQITLQDKASNIVTFRADNPIVAAVRVNVGGESCDSEPPRLQSLTLDQAVVNLGREPAFVTVTVMATDDSCGVDGVSGQYIGPGMGSGGFFPLQSTGANAFVGRIPLDPHAARGMWRITAIHLTDKGHNLRMYSIADPMVAAATFQVR